MPSMKPRAPPGAAPMLAERHAHAVAAQPHRHAGTAAATRSRSGKPCQRGDVDRADGSAGQVDRPGRGDAHGTRPRRRPAATRRRSARRPRPTPARPSPAGVGRMAVCTSAPSGSARPAAILVPPMSRQRVSMAISAGGCCRVGAGRRDARSRGRAGPARPGGRPATPGRRAAARRRADARRSAPAPAAAAGRDGDGSRQPSRSGRGAANRQRVAGVVVGHVVVGDLRPRR